MVGCLIYDDNDGSVLDKIISDIEFEKKLMPGQKGHKRRTFCKKCGEVTTQKFDVDGKTNKGIWICLCCESGKRRSISELKKIKKTRKGWANRYHK